MLSDEFFYQTGNNIPIGPNLIVSTTMARIYVDMSGDAYEVKITGSEDGGSGPNKTLRADELPAYLRLHGCNDTGLSNLLEQLKTSTHAEIDL